MLAGAALLPHPPIILPAHAAERGDEVEATIVAVRAACDWVARELRPDRLVVSSPHPAHGFDVPLHFLREAMGTLPPMEPLLTDQPSYRAYRRLGETLRRDSSSTDERVVVIASGDCSHRLREDGPYGFHPLGPTLDRAIRDAVSQGSADALLDIDPVVVSEGGECGLRSFIFALAALRPGRCEILSYQAPYGVGYLVATAAAGRPPSLPFADG
ncbi:MAG: hypothetical protein E6J14_13020 [Chloroflexi bacterium]|nr:MAG: hypothetical protein E6J14_13020 [Chloroflexota bacterium]